MWGGSARRSSPTCASRTPTWCVGEGEQVIVDLAQRIDAGEPLTNVPGVWAKDAAGEIIRNPGRPLLELEDLAIPDFDPARTLHINDDQVRRNVYPPNLGNQYIIMTTRGCPFSCSFCIESVYQDMFGKKNHLRRRSVDVVIQELVAARRQLNFKSVMFYDDVFTTHPRWLKEFASRYKAEVGLPFWCYTYPTTTKKEEIEMLRDAGCVSMTMGIQSGSEEVLNGFNRPVAREKAVEASRILLEAGVEPYFDLITRASRVRGERARDVRLPVRAADRDALCRLRSHDDVPGYGYSKKVTEEGRTLSLTDKEYAYYHRLYLLTRTTMPRFLVKAVGRLPLFRRYPALIERMLPKELPIFFLGEEDEGSFSSEILNLPHAQAVIPGGQLDRGLPPEATLQ